MSKTTALNELVDTTMTQIQPETGKKFVDLDTVVTILIFQGLKVLLPEIKEWVKRAMNNIGDSKNFILSTADDTVFGTPMENIAAIPKAIDEIYG